MLFVPWFVTDSIVLTVLPFVGYLLMLIALFLEVFLNIYKIIPVDMYETGMKVVIEDQKLLKELEQRKR